MIPKPFHMTNLEFLRNEAMFNATVLDEELAGIVESHPGVQAHKGASSDYIYLCFVHPLYDPETVWLELAYALEKAVADRQMWEAGIPEVEL